MGRIFTKLKSECQIGHEGFNFVKIPTPEVSLTILKTFPQVTEAINYLVWPYIVTECSQNAIKVDLIAIE